jgi:hypothetical protein
VENWKHTVKSVAKENEEKQYTHDTQPFIYLEKRSEIFLNTELQECSGVARIFGRSGQVITKTESNRNNEF